MAYHFTTDNFTDEVMNSSIPVLVDFYADWCGPCRMMGPIVERMATKYDGKVKVGKINVDSDPDIAGQFNVMSIPAFFFIKDGKVVSQTVGGMREEDLDSRIATLI